MTTHPLNRMVFKVSPVLQLPRRKLIVSSQEINLNIADGSMQENTIFVLMVKESSGSAGGRGGG